MHVFFSSSRKWQDIRHTMSARSLPALCPIPFQFDHQSRKPGTPLRQIDHIRITGPCRQFFPQYLHGNLKIRKERSRITRFIIVGAQHLCSKSAVSRVYIHSHKPYTSPNKNGLSFKGKPILPDTFRRDSLCGQRGGIFHAVDLRTKYPAGEKILHDHFRIGASLTDQLSHQTVAAGVGPVGSEFLLIKKIDN